MPERTDTERVDFIEALYRRGGRFGQFAGSGIWFISDFGEIYPLQEKTFRQAIDAAMDREAQDE